MAQYSLSSASNLFKIKYGKLSENTYNSANVVLARVKKSYDFVGKQMDVAVPTSFAGGVGSGSLPTANKATYADAIITAKKVYGVVEIQREAIKASANDEGAFVRMTKHVVQKGVESYTRNLSRILFNDGSGALGSFSGNAAGTASAPVLTITAATWKEANWEEGDYINVNTLSSVFEVTAVAPSTKAITLSRISGSDDLTGIGAGTHVAYMQNSKDNDPEGLKGVLDATSSTKYSVSIARRWQAFQKAAGGAGISADLLNENMLGVEKQCGKSPNLIVAGYTQFRKILNFLEDQKQYVIEPRSADLKGKISFKGIEFMSTSGPVPIVYDRFVEDDRVYFLNDDYIHIYHRPGFGWFDDDGTVFLRKASDDAYDARYGGYMQIYIPPSFHGVMTGLAT